MTESISEKQRKKVRIQVPVTGMTCTNCAATIEKGLAETEGIGSANVNFASEKATVDYDPDKVNLTGIKDKISDLGYGIATKKSIFPVAGMTCAACVARVEEALKEVSGVMSVSVNLASEKATVEYLEGTQYTDMKKAVEEAGYELGPEAESLEDVSETSKREIRKIRNRFIFAAVFAIPIMVMMFTPEFYYMKYVLLALATPVQFWAGWRFYKGMWGALKHRTSDMNTLIAVGTSAAYFYSVLAVFFPGIFTSGGLEAHVYFDTSSAIITLILLGRFLEARAKGQTSDAIKKLIGMQPKTATVIRNGEEHHEEEDSRGHPVHHPGQGVDPGLENVTRRFDLHLVFPRAGSGPVPSPETGPEFRVSICASTWSHGRP